MRCTIWSICISLRTGDCHLDIEYRLSCPVWYSCSIKFLIGISQAILRTIVVFTIGHDFFQYGFYFSPMVWVSVLSVIYGRLVHSRFCQKCGCGPFVNTSHFCWPCIRQVVISILEIFCDLIPYVNIISALIYIRNLRVYIRCYILIIYIRNCGSK